MITKFKMEIFKISSNKELGRIAVLNRHVKAGDIVLNEIPFVVGPKQNSSVICLECYSPVNIKSSDSKCYSCGWPLCNLCQARTINHKEECNIFADKHIIFHAKNYSSSLLECPQLDCITPLRMLLKMESDPHRWEMEVAPMEYHDAARRAATDIWQADLVNIARYLRGPCNLKRFSEDLIMKVIGILEVNAFEARTAKGYPFRALYPLAGILAHSCIPNAIRSIYPSEDFRLKLRAMVNLKTGDQLNHAYTYTFNGTSARLQHLKIGKYFICKCERCKDPTELATHFSSLKCIKCYVGLVSTTDPFDSDADWICSNCNMISPALDIENTLKLIQSEIDDVQAMEIGPNRLTTTEELCTKYNNILHPNHYLQTSLCQSLIEMYGRVKGYEMPTLPKILIERKIELCRQILKLLDIFEPGISRYRSIILYELHVPLVLLAKAELEDKLIQSEGFRSRILTAIEALEECSNILRCEDYSSQEGSLALKSEEAKKKLEKSIDII